MFLICTKSANKGRTAGLIVGEAYDVIRETANYYVVMAKNGLGKTINKGTLAYRSGAARFRVMDWQPETAK